MSVQVETLEKNMAKLTVEIEAERLEKALDAAYNKQKKADHLCRDSVRARFREPWLRRCMA